MVRLNHTVSTHSRPKAAAHHRGGAVNPAYRFNTQPPEGGCSYLSSNQNSTLSFNTQPPEGGCPLRKTPQPPQECVSTHSHPKVAARQKRVLRHTFTCFNTQTPEGGCLQYRFVLPVLRCFNTQPPEGGCILYQPELNFILCFNTQPPEGGCPVGSIRNGF